MSKEKTIEEQAKELVIDMFGIADSTTEGEVAIKHLTERDRIAREERNTFIAGYINECYENYIDENGDMPKKLFVMHMKNLAAALTTPLEDPN